MWYLVQALTGTFGARRQATLWVRKHGDGKCVWLQTRTYGVVTPEFCRENFKIIRKGTPEESAECEARLGFEQSR